MIAELQSALLDMPQVEIETSHTFFNGVYTRSIKIPKGVCLVGAKHKTRHPYVLSQGRIIVVDNDIRTEIAAPYTGITEIGTKRAIYAEEDSIFTTFHPTDKTDVEEIEKDIIEPEGLKIANNPVGVLK